MKKQIFRILTYVLLVFMTVALTACASEEDTLQSRIETLEQDYADLQSEMSTLYANLERTQSDLSRTRSEVQNLQAALDAADDDDQPSQQTPQSGELTITYEGNARRDMSWPLRNGDLRLGIRGDILSEIGEDDEIIWTSTNEDIFTVVASEDGLSAVVTPKIVGDAQLIVTIGDKEARSWVRIT